MATTDIIIIGGEIVGLATAYNLTQQYPDKTITILEKEDVLAFHQSGRNSGVLHTGIYYKPGSLKAKNCRTGKVSMEAFCREEEIDFKLCGKVIVATNADQLEALQTIYERGQANGVNCEIISRERLLEIEPHVTNAVKAIHVPEAGIVDYKQVCQRFADHILAAGNRIVTGAKVMGIEERAGEVTAVTTQGDFTARYLINCAGGHSDRVTKLSGGDSPVQIIPFRGEYFELKPEARYLCNSLIYPVPDPKFPFLGVHFTLMISGAVTCGPNAVLAFAREGYHLTDVNGRDLWETLTYPGFRKMAGQYWKTGLGEMWRSASKRAFVKALQHLAPAIRVEHLKPYPAGIRAQAIQSDGSMMDDFAFQETPRILNVLNAPSPAATSSISVGQTIVEKLAAHFD
jgi:L-2-hydroxyglutarate oxidase